MNGSEEIDLGFSLAGRLRNVSLPPSQSNSLVPLFESISNAIHAIEERFCDDAAKMGKISIKTKRGKIEGSTQVSGFVVTDNGSGLNESNWTSFRTSDSPHKFQKGGKGVGRLGLLKAFEAVQFSSIFERDGRKLLRQFEFSDRQPGLPIKSHALLNLGSGDIGTKVEMIPFREVYGAQCPRKLETIACKIVGHFLPYFVANTMPDISISDDSNTIELKSFFRLELKKQESVDFTLASDGDDGEHFNVTHLMIHKSIKFDEAGNHWIFFSGNDRVVEQNCIDNQIGLKFIGDHSDCVYIGIVTGEYLNNHINQERTKFTFDHGIMPDLQKMAQRSCLEFLAPYISQVRKKQVDTANKIIRNNPQFISFKDHLDEFVENNLTLNTQSEEEIFLELSRRKLRSRRQIEGRIKSLALGKNDELGEEIKKITSSLNEEKKGSLAEYVVRRKSILDIFDDSLAYENPEKRKYFKESIVHGLIVPLMSDKDDLSYENHNLWILDDRMAFYTYFLSDKPFKVFTDGDSRKEPDLSVFFDRSLAFHGENSSQPVIIVEFKRPGRDDYDGNSSPVSQVLDYVDIFRSGKAVKDKSGTILRKISNETRFICYIIADLTDSLKRVVRYSSAANEMPDGDGYFGFSAAHNAWIEVIPYQKVVHDAKLRHEAFFKELGI